MKVNYEKQSKNNDSISFDYLNKSTKDNKKEKYFFTKKFKTRIEPIENLERKEKEKMQNINQCVKTVYILEFTKNKQFFYFRKQKTLLKTM